MFAPKSTFFCGPGDGEKLFDPKASGRKGQECPREIRTEKFMFMLFFSSLILSGAKKRGFLEGSFLQKCTPLLVEAL